MSLAQDIHNLEPGELVDLYILDLNSIGVGQVQHYYPGADLAGLPVRFQGVDYTPLPVVVEGFQKKGTGAEKRPVLTISNVFGIFSSEVALHDDLVGATITRRRTLGKYLGTDTVDRTVYRDEIYFIEQKTAEDHTVIQFELASAMDFLDKKLPGRTAVANSCPWRYKSVDDGSGCGWPGVDSGKWFDQSGVQVFTLNEDVCGKKISDCKLRFGSSEPLDYGGFPSLGRV